MEQGFVISRPGREKGHVFARRVPVLCCAVLLLLCAALLLIPAFRQSAAMLCNRLFDASEQVNRYAYTRFLVPDGTTETAALVMLGLIGVTMACLALFARSVLPAVLIAAVVAGAQAWLGLSLPVWGNIVLFAFLLLCVAVHGGGRRVLLPCVVCIAVVSLVTAVILPGTHTAVENASEWVRDRLDPAPEALVITETDEAASVMETRPENLRDLNEGTATAREAEPYRLVTVEEQQIALPQWVDYLRIILMVLLIPVALAVPFVPLWWMNRCARKASARRTCLESNDPRETVTGGFALINDYLDACGITEPNRLYTRRMEHCAALPEDVKTLYDQCARVWEEAAYSDHPVPPDAPAQVEQLLERIEEELYDKADRRTRLRLRFVCCLHE